MTDEKLFRADHVIMREIDTAYAHAKSPAPEIILT